MVSRLGYDLIDADNHYYESPDCFSRHIEQRYRDKAVTTSRAADGSWEVRVGDKPYSFMDPKFDKTNPPGSMYTILRQVASGTANASWGSSYSADNMHPAFQHRDDRLRLMDEQDIEQAVLLPTFGVTVEAAMLDDVEQTYANLRSFNRWLEEEWGYSGRIVAPPLLSLLDLEPAIDELERVLDLGAGVVHLRPGPTGSGRSPADPYYDPFWSRIQEAGAIVAFHIADYRYPEISRAWGEDPDPPVREMSAFQWAFVHGDRPIMETFGALIYGNLFGRFPDLKVMSLENGSGWVGYLLDLLDKKKGMGKTGPWIGGRPAGRPSDTFKRHCWVSPYPEDDVPALVHRLGADRVLFGSDYPHPEGLELPVDFVDRLTGCSEEEVRLIMRDNAAGLLQGASR